MIKKSIFLCLTLIALSANADVKEIPSAFAVDASGADGMAIFKALQAAGFTPSIEANAMQVFSIKSVSVDAHSNGMLPGSDPCYDIPTYNSIVITDDSGKITRLTNAPGCSSNSAAALGKLLDSMGGTQTASMAMASEYTYLVTDLISFYAPSQNLTGGPYYANFNISGQ